MFVHLLDISIALGNSISVNMSRATDAFSSLISNVPGVDTSCFVKRTLNDLKTKDATPPPTPATPCQKPVVKSAQTENVDFSFASADLDALGKPSTPKGLAHDAVILEDLFEHIPGCQEPQTDDAWMKFQSGASDGQSMPPVEEAGQKLTETRPQQPATEDLSNVSRMDASNASPWPRDDVIDDQTFVPVDHQSSMPTVQTDQRISRPEISDDPNSTSYAVLQNQDNETPFDDDRDDDYEFLDQSSKPSDLKSTFDRYRSTLNKKASSLKKKGLKAVRQGLDAAQEWMDKRLEDRKQQKWTSAQKKEDAKHIEQFLYDMEQLSCFRRQQLMAELPPEFFQKVMDYAEAKGLSVEHLFITGQEDVDPLESDPVLQDSDEDIREPDRPDSEIESNSPQQIYLDVTGESSFSQPSEEDILDLSEDAVHHPPCDFVDPDDLDAFFTAPVQESNPEISIPDEHHDLMKFDEGVSQRPESDYSEMYHRLKQSGRHSESEIRSILKEKRSQDKQNKMAAALKAKVERERETEARQEACHRLKDKYRRQISDWKEQHAGNMRGLLTTLESVLWENSGWKPLTVGDVLEVAQVKKAYMKANLIIHPDKVKQKGGSAEQVVVADMVFNVLKEAWQCFQS